MKSLLVIGHPKGLTTEVQRICNGALPDMTFSTNQLGRVAPGESLNVKENQPWFSKDDALYQRCAAKLLQLRSNFIIKDVLQPYACARFLQEYPDVLNVLFVDRNIEDVYVAQRLRGWYISDEKTWEEAIAFEACRGRIKNVKSVFKRFPSITDEELLYEINPIHDLLSSLGYNVDIYQYINTKFIQYREKTHQKIKVFRNAHKEEF